eukprot:maker-scaffold_22-snap-gene-3.57-mRNA-1 protein AED:0.42 eAED:0.42 QI:34/1/1/1/1/1/2/46/146
MNCGNCEKKVYRAEMLKVNSEIFHHYCFKCEVCQRKLNLGNFATMEKKFYCKPHFFERFKKQGGRYKKQSLNADNKENFSPVNNIPKDKVKKVQIKLKPRGETKLDEVSTLQNEIVKLKALLDEEKTKTQRFQIFLEKLTNITTTA